MALEESGECGEWDQVDPVIEIDVPRIRDDQQLLGLGSALKGVFAAFTGMRVGPGNQQQWTWCSAILVA